MQSDGIELESPIDITNAFATHFKSVFVKPSETNFSYLSNDLIKLFASYLSGRT